MRIDKVKYHKLVKSVGSLSELFSDDKTVYLSPKFVERLFVFTTGSLNIAGKDISFDAITPERGGVGVKTFRSKSPDSSSLEKVAEFTSFATSGEFTGLTDRDLVRKVAIYRNDRIITDAKAYGIDLDRSFYHCLIRTPEGCLVHEEPYPLIDVENIRLLSKRKNPVFTDGKSRYSFSSAKSVLYKEFVPKSASKLIKAKPHRNIFESLDLLELIDQSKKVRNQDLDQEFIVLPLYGSNSAVNEKSGINLWNAEGRKRRFGEGYIPFPAEVRGLYPAFFPGIEETFTLKLSSGEEIPCKVCQQEGKAIMSSPNHLLLEWLFRLIDTDAEASSSRFVERRPYTMADLKRVGKDSVKFTVLDKKRKIYSLEPMALGSYEEFMGIR